ncbi:MAG TPA: hypothetical protein VEC57_01920 [Candidatus Limnocylindrales bacterium]|nr:hypothetical protein [Candidatus Limnocylindrales bacterium]
MRPSDRKLLVPASVIAAAALWLGLAPDHALAQGLLQLDPIPPEYTLGRFQYTPPRHDGWRQIANSTQSLQLVYVEQTPGSDQINTKFGVVMEAHDIPAGTQIPSPSWLAELSRKQQADARKDEITGVSPILLVPGTTNIYTYRFLAKTPPGAAEPDAYEVYYVTMSPDEKQYLVVQCITKEKTYENQLYFQQFYATLSSIRYQADAAGAAPGASGTSGDAKAAGDAAPSDGKPAPVTPPAPPAPAVPPPPPAPASPSAPAGEDHSGHGH